MQYTYQAPTTPDERTMALLAHVLQLVGGFIGPLVIFLIRKDQAPFVRFHALQALIWQLILLVTGLVVIGTMVALMVSSIIASGGMQHAPAQPPAGFLLGMAIIYPYSFCVGALNLVLAIVYGLKANKGEWAEYPIIGAWARSWARV